MGQQIKTEFDWRAVMKACDGTSAVHRAGQVIFVQGGAADALYCVINGCIKVAVVSKHGKEGVIGLVSPGEFFGEAGLRGQRHQIATATALTDCVVARLPVQAVWRALHDNGAFAETFAIFLLARVEKLEADVVDHLVNSSERRLARLLLMMARADDRGPITPRIDQQTLARMIGTTRPRVSEFMSKFRKQGHIAYDHGQIRVQDSLLDVVLSEPFDARKRSVR